MGVVGL